jgi:hypothetical protein
MPTYADPLELLEAMNPVPNEDALAPTRDYVPAQRTLQRILAAGPALLAGAGVEAAEDEADVEQDPDTGTGGSGPPPPRHRRRLLVAVGVVAVSAVLAAAVYIASRRADDPTRVACYAAADLEADTVALGAAAGGNPLGACEEQWQTGAFQGWGVPPLAGCVLTSGIVGVFPGEPSVCDRLGLARLATESGDWEARVLQLVSGLRAELAAPNCVDVAVAADRVRQRLEQLDLDGWTLIAPATTVPERPCTSIAFDPPAKTITLVPIPPPSA